MLTATTDATQTAARVYMHQFDGSGNPVGSYVLIPGQVQSISVGRDSAGKPLLYMIGLDDQVYVHQFDASNNSVGTCVLIPDLVRSIALTDGPSLQ
jgi:hypothetical protein